MKLSSFLFIFVLANLWYTIKKRGTNLCNEIFWLSIFWVLCIGTFITGGVTYGGYGLTTYLLIYLFFCFSAFFIGRRKGLSFEPNETDEEEYPEINRSFILLGLFGVLIYFIDVLRLNSFEYLLSDVDGKKSVELSILGTIGVLIMPLSLVIGLFLLTRDLIYNSKISLLSILLLLAYTVPAAITGGRESILFVVIGIVSSLSFAKIKGSSFTTTKSNIIYVIGILGIITLVYAIYKISTSRFGDVQTRVFLNNNAVSLETINDAATWGSFEFLYYNILSYFCRQIPFLDFTLHNYDGPYLFGFFELNILSRRLPDSFELDYLSVFDKLNTLFSIYNVDFGRGWFTVLGALICDFGRLGSFIICYICGYTLGKTRKLLETTMNIKYSVLTSLFCLSAFSSVQLGPFFQTMIYSTYIWWYILFNKNTKNL